MGWSSDLESGGGRFDSWLAQRVGLVNFGTHFQKRTPLISDTGRSSRREHEWKKLVRTSRLFLDGSAASKYQPKNSNIEFDFGHLGGVLETGIVFGKNGSDSGRRGSDRAGTLGK